MMIIGVDYHPSFQQIAFLDQETGECGERELNHSDGEAERFYRELKERGVSVRVGMEATGHALWFERLLAELGFELWIGDPAENQRFVVCGNRVSALISPGKSENRKSGSFWDRTWEVTFTRAVTCGNRRSLEMLLATSLKV